MGILALLNFEQKQSSEIKLFTKHRLFWILSIEINGDELKIKI